MFDKNKFAHILNRINATYTTMTEFAKKASFDRTYISKYIHLNLDNPPTPKILMKIANNSNGITTYEELMLVCGYLEKDMEFTEVFKKIFYRHLPSLKELNLDDGLIDVMYKMVMDGTQKYEKEFDNSLAKLPQELQDKVYTISAEILEEVNEIMRNSINNIKLRAKYSIDDDSLMKTNKSKLNDLNNLHLCPVYGKISAGQPNWAEECMEGYLPLDPNLMEISNPDECFFLKVNGESMNKVVKNGAYALIRKQDYAEDGEIVVAIINGDNEATLKKFKRFNEQFVSFEPMSSDESIKPINVDLKSTNVIILGKYIGKFEMN